MRRIVVPLVIVGVALLVVNRPAEPLPFAADAVVIRKRAHSMDLIHKGDVMRTYRVSLGRGGLAPKEKSGDMRTPEGVYTIAEHNPQSSYHLSLRVGYPTREQVAAAHVRGVDPGGDIMIHGIRNGFGWLGTLQRRADWTQGCVALTDSEMEAVYRSVGDGVKVTILP